MEVQGGERKKENMVGEQRRRSGVTEVQKGTRSRKERKEGERKGITKRALKPGDVPVPPPPRRSSSPSPSRLSLRPFPAPSSPERKKEKPESIPRRLLLQPRPLLPRADLGRCAALLRLGFARRGDGSSLIAAAVRERLLLLGGLEDLERAQERLVDAHHRAGVVELAAVVPERR